MGKNRKDHAAKKSKKPPLQVKQQLDEMVEELLKKCTKVIGVKDWKHFTDIYELVQKIQAIEEEYVCPVIVDRRDENMELFLSWCCNNAAKFNTVQVKNLSANNYGVIAEEDIQDGDLLFVIPRKLMITTSTAMESKLAPLIEKDAILQHMPNVVLAFHLMVEACEISSFWKPYIQILPYRYTTPLHFTPSELKELQASHTLDACFNLYQSIARQYAYFYKLFQVNPDFKKLSLKQHFSFDFYRWAVSTVMTRQNSLPSANGQSSFSALVPLWDMCNHSNGRFSTDFDQETDEIRCFAMREFRKKDEVHIFYGPRTNSELFLHSGFVLLENDHDEIPLKLGISKSDALYNLKCKLCAKLGISTNGKYVLKSGSQPVDEDLIMFARIFSLTKDSLPEEHNNDDLLLEWLRSNDAINTKAREFLKTRISLILRSYSTSIEEDEDFLQTSMSPHHSLALRLRFTEKTIYNRTLTYLESCPVC